MERDFKGVWIPKEIWLSKKITLQEKVFLVEIDSLDNDEGCFAGNSYFAEFFGLSKNRCSEVIKSLEFKGLVTIEYVRETGKKNIEKRIIRVVDKSNRCTREIDRPTRKIEEGYSEKCEDNNTLINNTINKKKDKPSKHAYAEYVYMTENEYSKLVQQYGKENVSHMINKLDNYKGSKGRQYKSDYRAILSWVANEIMNKIKPKEIIQIRTQNNFDFGGL